MRNSRGNHRVWTDSMRFKEGSGIRGPFSGSRPVALAYWGPHFLAYTVTLNPNQALNPPLQLILGPHPATFWCSGGARK